jgi:hypothetical protein
VQNALCNKQTHYKCVLSLRIPTPILPSSVMATKTRLARTRTNIDPVTAPAVTICHSTRSSVPIVASMRNIIEIGDAAVVHRSSSILSTVTGEPTSRAASQQAILKVLEEHQGQSPSMTPKFPLRQATGCSLTALEPSPVQSRGSRRLSAHNRQHGSASGEAPVLAVSSPLAPTFSSFPINPTAISNMEHILGDEGHYQRTARPFKVPEDRASMRARSLDAAEHLRACIKWRANLGQVCADCKHVQSMLAQANLTTGARPVDIGHGYLTLVAWYTQLNPVKRNWLGQAALDNQLDKDKLRMEGMWKLDISTSHFPPTHPSYPSPSITRIPGEFLDVRNSASTSARCDVIPGQAYACPLPSLPAGVPPLPFYGHTTLLTPTPIGRGFLHPQDLDLGTAVPACG